MPIETSLDAGNVTLKVKLQKFVVAVFVVLSSIGLIAATSQWLMGTVQTSARLTFKRVNPAGALEFAIENVSPNEIEITSANIEYSSDQMMSAKKGVFMTQKHDGQMYVPEQGMPRDSSDVLSSRLSGIKIAPNTSEVFHLPNKDTDLWHVVAYGIAIKLTFMPTGRSATWIHSVANMLGLSEKQVQRFFFFERGSVSAIAPNEFHKSVTELIAEHPCIDYTTNSQATDCAKR